MVSFGKFIKTLGKGVITPARVADNLVINVAADGSRYFLTKAVPSPWVWDRIPNNVKTALKNQLLDHNSRTRVTLDSLVTAALGLVIADKVAGPDVAIYRGAFEFYANNRLLAAGLTIGVPAIAVAVYDGVKRNIPNWGKLVYGAGIGIAVVSLIAAPFIGHPVGSQGASGPEKPAVVEQKPLTQQDLEAYVATTLLPLIQKGISTGNEEQNKALQEYVTKFVADYFDQQLAEGGYVTASDLEKLGLQISGQINSLESRINAAQATSTAVPPTPTPAVAKPGVLEGYLNRVSTKYVVPVALIRPLAGSDAAGLASALKVSPAVLKDFTDGTDANGEFVTLEVSITGVIANAQYAGVGQRPIPLSKETDPLIFSRYLQSNLPPDQLASIQPVRQ